MKQIELIDLTDQELLQEGKKRKSAYISYCMIFGILIGIAIYSTVKNGFGFFTFFPLFFAPIGATSRTNFKAVEKEIQSRNLK